MSQGFTRESSEAPADAAYVTLALNANLTNERVLTGTANQIIITDNGGNSTVVLSLPQDIHTGASPTFVGLNLSGLTISRVVVTDGSKNLASSATTATEVGYVSGVTSAIQTQIDGKQTLDADLTAIAALSLTGFPARTASNTWSLRTLTGTANQVVISNGDGVSGNPTFSLPQSIHTAATPTFASMTLTAASSITLGTASSATGAILLKNSSNSNTLTLQAGATGSALTFTLPIADGTNGQFIKTNGSGVLSFATPTDTGVTTIGTIDSQTAATNGAVISGVNLYMQSASSTKPGLVNNTTQTFSGSKTFSSLPTFSSLTAKSVLFAGTGGLIAEDRPHFYFDTSAGPSLHVYDLYVDILGTGGGILFTNTGGRVNYNPSYFHWNETNKQFIVGPQQSVTIAYTPGTQTEQISGPINYNGDVPTGATGVINYGQSSGYLTNGYTHTTRFYSYNALPSGKLAFSQTYTSATVTDDGRRLSADGIAVDGSLTANVNYGGSGYIADNTSRTYYIFSRFTYPAGVAVNSTPLSVAQTVDDNSSNLYQVDLATWMASGANVDGYYLYMTDSNGGTFYKDIGNVTTYSDMNSGWTSGTPSWYPSGHTVPDYYNIDYGLTQSTSPAPNGYNISGYFAFNFSTGSTPTHNYDYGRSFSDSATPGFNDPNTGWAGFTYESVLTYGQASVFLGDVNIYSGNINLNFASGSGNIVGGGGQIGGFQWIGTTIGYAYGGTNATSYGASQLIWNDAGHFEGVDGSGVFLSSTKMLTLTSNADNVETLTLNAHSGTQSAAMLILQRSGTPYFTVAPPNSTGYLVKITTPTASDSFVLMTAPTSMSGQFIRLYDDSANNMFNLDQYGFITIGTGIAGFALAVKPFQNVTPNQTAIFQDATATTGSTRVTIKAGAGQSTSTLFEIQKSNGAILASFGATGVLSLGLAGTQTGTINMIGTTSGTVTISPAAAAGTWTLTLPTTGGTSGYGLTTDGSGTSTWSRIPLNKASGRATAQTAANTSVSTFTVGAADASFLVSANVLVTTSTLHSFGVTVDYTDESNTARTLTLPFSQLAGTFITAITNATGVGPYEGAAVHIRCKASTAITFKTAGTFTTVTYNVEGFVNQL